MPLQSNSALWSDTFIPAKPERWFPPMLRAAAVSCILVLPLAANGDEFPLTVTYETKCTTLPPGKGNQVSSFQYPRAAAYVEIVSSSFMRRLDDSPQEFQQGHLEVKGAIANIRFRTYCADAPAGACCPRKVLFEIVDHHVPNTVRRICVYQDGKRLGCTRNPEFAQQRSAGSGR